MTKPITYYLHLSEITARELETLSIQEKLALAKGLIELSQEEVRNREKR
ncbi:hypothetical protein V2H45_05865 [Tumidithrix elongata RA019]|uniref:Uncharacterized protein n=1 Tax=Tumidithrix elongata BACA0141 TaxID=2716417 RepID=A0AAW9PUC4_9CYAN|nr:hypothetical protein [Tumidithrix elongata RA019]